MHYYTQGHSVCYTTPWIARLSDNPLIGGGYTFWKSGIRILLQSCKRGLLTTYPQAQWLERRAQ
jgi:hypothetical protein